MKPQDFIVNFIIKENNNYIEKMITLETIYHNDFQMIKELESKILELYDIDEKNILIISIERGNSSTKWRPFRKDMLI